MALLLTDPVCFKRDTNGDVKFPLDLARGLEAAAIGVRTRLALFAGEFFANLDAGVPWIAREDGSVTELAAIIGQAFDEPKARAALRREVLTTPGVTEIPVLLFAFNAAERKLGITFVARTVWGDTPRDTLELEL